jgi:hypothetical protein
LKGLKASLVEDGREGVEEVLVGIVIADIRLRVQRSLANKIVNAVCEELEARGLLLFGNIKRVGSDETDELSWSTIV